MKVASRLAEPLDEYRLTQQSLRNLLPDIRQTLLFVLVLSVTHLRQLIHKCENFLGDVESRRSSKITAGLKVFRRALAAVEAEKICLNPIDFNQRAVWTCFRVVFPPIH